MAAPVIAVVGSFDPARREELALAGTPEAAQRAGEVLGTALADQGFHILVYTSAPYMLEVDVVRGYTASPKAKPGSIQVRYSYKHPAPHFAEQQDPATAACFARPTIDHYDDWEVSFYRSLSEIDGILLLGGGRSTHIAGIVAAAFRKPVLACPAFGGKAQSVWRELSTLADYVESRERDLMAGYQGLPPQAEECARVLHRQSRRIREERMRKEHPRKSPQAHRATTLQVHGGIAVVGFLAALLTWPLTWDKTTWGYQILLGLLVVAPLLTGVSGATARVLFDQCVAPPPRPPVLPAGHTVVLGLLAGGLSALFFTAAQLVAMPQNAALELKQIQAGRLVPFVIGLGFISGFTLDKVLATLLKIEPPKALGSYEPWRGMPTSPSPGEGPEAPPPEDASSP